MLTRDQTSKILPLGAIQQLVFVLMVLVSRPDLALAQAVPALPSVPTTAPATKETPKQKMAAPTKDNPQATVAEAPGPINVEKPVNAFKVKDFLEETLAKYPGVYSVHADVNGSVVTLTGHVQDEEIRDRLTQVALKVEGVVFVANNLKTDAQILSAPELLVNELRHFWGMVRQNWLLFLLAISVFLLSVVAARLFSRFSEVLLIPFTGNVLLRSVLGSLISGVLVAVGLLTALQVFGMANAVFSVLGLAGVAALAIGFAFRDITENFIASILLSTRRPFSVGDYIEVAGQAGVVKALNTRATVLLTLDGKTVRIPNSMVFKEIVSNASSASGSRTTFDVLIPYEVSTAQAMEVIGAALKDHEAILNDPPPRALVEELNPAGVKLRVYYWMPTKGVDGFKVNSDAKLKTKVALLEAGIRPPAITYRMVNSDAGTAGGNGTSANGTNGRSNPMDHAPVVTRNQAKANLAQDSRAAKAAAEVTPEDRLMEHVRNMDEGDVSTEGKNLIADSQKPTEDGSPEDSKETAATNAKEKEQPVESTP